MGKKAIVHVDLILGLSSKEISVDFIKKYTKADGIISMKPTLIKRQRTGCSRYSGSMMERAYPRTSSGNVKTA